MKLVKRQEPSVAVRDRTALDILKAQAAARPPSQREALLLLLDGSGSMAGASWQALSAAVGEFAAASDGAACTLALAVFASAADLLAGFTDQVRRVPDRLPEEAPGGGTAMREALAFAGGLAWSEGRRRVILFSDGYPTSGDPVPEARRLGEAGVVVDAVGCDGADVATLEAIAEATGGRYTHASQVTDLAAALRLLETRVRGFLSAP